MVTAQSYSDIAQGFVGNYTKLTIDTAQRGYGMHPMGGKSFARCSPRSKSNCCSQINDSSSLTIMA